MQITHHLKDGTVLTDIKGHIVKMEDAQRAYDIMKTIRNNQILSDFQQKVKGETK